MIRPPMSVLLVALTVVACTISGPSNADLEGRLLGTDDLPASWTATDELATAFAGGFCDLDRTVQTTDPAGEAAAVFVDGETLLRQSLYGYATQDDATATRVALEHHLRDCPDSEVGRQLDIVVTERPSWTPDTTRLRLEVDVAEVPLVLDLAIWQHHDVVGVLRLTYPNGSHDDPLGTHQTVTTAAQARLSDP